MPTKIQWAEETWNPIVGCSKVSPGCASCYAIRDARRLSGNPNPKIRNAYEGTTTTNGKLNWTGVVRLIPERLQIPLRRKKATRWFVNSMSDLFHEALTDEEIDQVFAVMALCPQHVFMVLTKRAERMRDWFQPGLDNRPDSVGHQMRILSNGKHAGILMDDWPLPNAWLGVSVENQETADERIPLLLQTPAAVRFVSAEPLLGQISFRWAKWHDYSPGVNWGHLDGMKGIHWVITGGESGPNARPANPDWFRKVRDDCQAAGVAYFHKQWGEWVAYNQIGGAGVSRDDSAPIEKPRWRIHSHSGGDWLFDGRSFEAQGLWPNQTTLVRVGKKAAGRLLDGRTWDQFPEARRST